MIPGRLLAAGSAASRWFRANGALAGSAAESAASAVASGGSLGQTGLWRRIDSASMGFELVFNLI